MFDIPWVTLDVERFSTKKQQQLMKLLNDKNVRTEVNTRILNAINNFVPMKTGALRQSGYATSTHIGWGQNLPAPYARYQYNGLVYVPNRPITKGGTIVGWFSPPGQHKHPDPNGRELGVPGEWKGWRFGYTTPGTRHHWDRAFQYQVKQKTNLEITRYLKRECKNRGLNT